MTATSRSAGAPTTPRRSPRDGLRPRVLDADVRTPRRSLRQRLRQLRLAQPRSPATPTQTGLQPAATATPHRHRQRRQHRPRSPPPSRSTRPPPRRRRLTLANSTAAPTTPGSGTRGFFKPDAATGSFDVTASSTDNDTGVASYTFPAGAASGTNWLGSAQRDRRLQLHRCSRPPAPRTSPRPTMPAVPLARAPIQRTQSDSTAPDLRRALPSTAQAASGGGTSSYDTDGSFPIDSRTDYSETASATESGLASSTLVRTTATFSSADTCGAFGSRPRSPAVPTRAVSRPGVTSTRSPAPTTSATHVSISTTVKVDTSAPSNPSLTLANATGGAYYSGAGTQIFIKPSAANGGFDLTASSSDADTGIAGYTFPTAGAMGTNWSVSGSGATRTYSFTPTAAEPGSKSVSAANNAGGSASSNFTVTADSTAPTTTIQCNGAACLNGTYYTSAPVSVTLSGNDGRARASRRFATRRTARIRHRSTDRITAVRSASTRRRR